MKLQKIEFKKKLFLPLCLFFKFYTPARSWYTDGSRPIVVQVGQLVGQDLNPIWRPTRFVQDDVVRCGVDGTLTNRLADEVEIIPEIYQIGQKLHKEQKWTGFGLIDIRFFLKQTKIWIIWLDILHVTVLGTFFRFFYILATDKDTLISSCGRLGTKLVTRCV